MCLIWNNVWLSLGPGVGQWLGFRNRDMIKVKVGEMVWVRFTAKSKWLKKKKYFFF